MDYLEQIMKEFLGGQGQPQQSPAPANPLALMQKMGIAGPQSPMPMGVGAPPQGMQPQQIVGGQPGPMGQVGQAVGMGSGAGDLLGATAAYQNTQNRRFGNTIAGGLESIYDAFQEPRKRADLVTETNLAAARDQTAVNQQELAELQKAKQAEQEANARGDNMYQAALNSDVPDAQARQMALAASADEKIYQKFMEQLGGATFEDKTTDSTRSREQRVDWAGTEEGEKAMAGMSPAERTSFITTGQQLPKGTVTNIETGTIPQDYRAIRDSNGRIVAYDVIPDSKTAREQKAEQVQMQQGWRDTVAGASNTRRAIDDAKALLGPNTTGFLGTALSRVWGTEAVDLTAVLDTVRANVAFDRLQQMRRASITGGALGNVSNREIQLLYSSAAPLGKVDDQGRAVIPSQYIMERSLNRIDSAYRRLEEYAKDPERFDNMTEKEYWDYFSSVGMPKNPTDKTQTEPAPPPGFKVN